MADRQKMKTPDKAKEEKLETAAPGDATAVEKVFVFEQRKKKKSTKIIKRIIISLIILAVLGVGALLLVKLFTPGETITPTGFVYRGSISSSVEGYGVALPKKSENVAVTAEGKVLELHVAEGDIVEEGALLYVIDSSEVEKQLESERQNLNNIQSSINDIYTKMAGLSVKTPCRGQVQDLTVAKGDMVGEGQTIAMIVDNSRMLLTQYFSYAYKDAIRVGQSATVSIPSSMASIAGKVKSIEYISKVSPEGGLMFEVVVELPNPGALTKGMAATASVSTASGIATPGDAGTLDYYDQQPLKVKSGGEITNITIRNYHEVEAGQLVVTLSNDSYKEQLDASRQSIDIAQKSYDAVRERLGSYRVTAPIGGTVLTCSINVGDEVSPGTGTVISIADLSVFKVDMQVDEMDIAKLAVGMPVEVTSENYYDDVFTSYFGYISSLSMVGKAENGVSFFPGEIEIEGTEGLMAGYYVNYKVMLSQADDVLLAPISAVQYTDLGTVVYLREGTRQPDEGSIADLPPEQQIEGFIPVFVQTGVVGDTEIEIISGLFDGDEIVTGSEQSDDVYGGMGMRGGSVVVMG